MILKKIARGNSFYFARDNFASFIIIERCRLMWGVPSMEDYMQRGYDKIEQCQAAELVAASIPHDSEMLFIYEGHMQISFCVKYICTQIAVFRAKVVPKKLRQFEMTSNHN